MRRLAVLACALCTIALLLVLLSASLASAATGHAFVSSLSEAPPGSSLLSPEPVAVDRASGELIVGDARAGYVDVFSSSGMFETRLGGGFLEPLGVAVGEENGDVYVADGVQNAIFVYEPDGKGSYRLLSRWSGKGLPAGAFARVAGVAVDNSASPSAGDVYVIEDPNSGTEGGFLDLFNPKPNPSEVEEGDGPEGEFLKRLSTPKLALPNGVAVSPTSGRVLLADSYLGAVFAFSATGAFEEKLTGKGSPGGAFDHERPVGDVAAVAVDELSGDVYVAEAERHAVSQYSAAGEWKGWITTTPAGDLAEPRGVALTPSGEVYAADAGRGLVDRFAAGAQVPSVETGKVAKSALTRTTAILPGTIDGGGKTAEYFFQFGETEALGSQTSVKGAGTGAEAVSAGASGLHAGTTYFYRLVGQNENGASYGVIREFETPPAVEALETDLVKNLAPDGATLTGSLKRGGVAASFHFEYGATQAYGSATAPQEVPPGLSEKEEKQVKTLEAAISGLQPNTPYHYRVVAENEFGTSFGSDRMFTTSGPPRITNEPTTAIGQEGATLHAKVNPDQIATTYRFQYGETTAYGGEAPLGGEVIGAGATGVAVVQSLSGLKLGTTYHFRVLAENEAGITFGEDRSFTTLGSAPVDATFATDLGTTEVTLHTRINPLGHDTHYYFQYGSESCQASPSACTDTPLPPGEDIGEGSEDAERELHLTGLTPGATYYYRVLSENALGLTEGPERTVTMREANPKPGALPDGRAWEMVSPPDKHGAPVEALTREGGIILASENGSSLAYLAGNALGEEAQGNRTPEWQQILATRGQDSWSSKDLATPSIGAKGAFPGSAPEYQFFNQDLSTALVQPFSRAGGLAEPPLAPGVKQATIYLRDNASDMYAPIVTEANTAPGTKFGGIIHFVSASPDLSHVVISSSGALTGAGSAPGLYEWADGTLKFVSILPNGTPAASPELGFFHTPAHGISSDGSRVIFTAKEESTAAGHLYMRDTVSGQTIQLDAAQGMPEPPKGSAQFQWASADGSRVLFTDKQSLTPDSTARPTEPPSSDLYECEIVEEAGKPKCQLHDLTVATGEGESAGVQYFILGASEDATSVYFVARGVLAANHNGNGESAEPGAANLYEAHFDGSQWATTFIATLSPEDSQEWEGFHIGNSAYLTARVSPHGRYLAFMSAAPITGYDNVDANPEAKGARDQEVFLYDAAQPGLRCVSCNSSGARPEGALDAEQVGEGVGLLVDRREIWLGHRLAGNIPGWTAQNLVSAMFQSRYLTDDGRLYFNSPDNLVPAAENRKENVYQYEPSGVGSCESASGGCVSLLSSGSSERESAFIEATPDGSGVFFETAAQLLPQDTDTAFDIYDARVCSELSPCLSPPAPEAPACAEAQTCRPAEPVQAIPGVSPASRLAGAGNLTPGTASQAPQHGVEGKKTVKPPTRAQKLARALARCHKRYAHEKRKRKACEKSARRRYGYRKKPSHATTNNATSRKANKSNPTGLAR